MKPSIKSISRFQQLLVLIMILVTFNLYSVRSAEFVIMNNIISFSSNGNAFSHLTTNFMSYPQNWHSPDDYYNGKFYAYFKVLDVPTNVPFGMQVGVFQYFPSKANWDHHNFNEVCSDPVVLQGIGNEVFYSGTPANWWKMDGRDVDFARVIDFQSVGPVLWGSNPSAPLIWTSGGGNDATWAQRAKWLPCTIQVVIVAVSYGSTFSGWANYLPNPALDQPTPNYGIYYINETTDAPVPSTNEFSIWSNMSSAVNGSGVPMQVTPGEGANFRTKAGNGLRKSQVQHIAVPCRPATPTFKYDAANYRTTTVVSSEYEYSDYENMSGAVDGTGTYVSIPSGTTKYFRKKATSTSFKSKVQALNASTVLPIAHEFLIINDTIDFPNATDTNGFYYFYYNADMPSNWMLADNYYWGEIYMRYEIISQKTATPVGLQFGIWQLQPEETGELHETMSEIVGMNGPGSIVETHSSPYHWWKLDNYLDFTKIDKTWHLGINPWRVDPYDRQIRQENPDVWSVRNNYWFPMKVHVSIVAVAYEHTFSGWDNYINTNPGSKKPTPNIAIDYINRTTSTVIPSTIEFSYNENMSYAENGKGQKLALIPGQDVYFRTKAADGLYASNIQHLVVPASANGPVFTLNFLYERTNENVTSDIEYWISDTLSGSSVGTGSSLSVTPGQDLYFRRKATTSTFASKIFHLVNPARPALPIVSIDYINEKTNEIISSSVEYTPNSNYTGAVSGTNARLDLNSGTDLYFWIKYSDTSYYSLVTTLDVPDRPQTPAITINYPNEVTSTVASTVEWSNNESMSTLFQGLNAPVTVTPGNDLYFRIKATSGSFKSAVQHLVVAGRPSQPAIAIDYLNEVTSIVSSSIEWSENASMTSSTSGQNTSVDVTPGVDLYFRIKPTSNSFKSLSQHLTVPARPSPPAITIDYLNEVTSIVPATIEWSENEDLSSATQGSGTTLNLVPGTDLYFRQKATSSAFMSASQHLNVASRPSTPSYTVNYLAEKTNESVSISDDYSPNSNMTDAVSGSNAQVSLNPGTDLYFRTRATSSSFRSNIELMVVPARPTTPSFSIDFTNGTTAESVSEDIEYSTHTNMSDPDYGAGEPLILIPGTDLYFRYRAGNTSFCSNKFYLEVPSNNFLGYSGNDTVNTASFVMYAILVDPSGILSLDDIQVTNGTAKNLREGNIFDVYPIANDFVHVIIPANSTAPNSFASNEVVVYYDGPVALDDRSEADVFTIHPNPSADGVVFIESTIRTPYSIEIFTGQGQLIKKIKVEESSKQALNLGDLEQGIYFIKLFTDNYYGIQKLIIE
jgi:hypothetical protein